MRRSTYALGAAFGCVAMLGACVPRQVSFSNDVRPILEEHCFECHLPGGDGHEASGLDMSSYASLMKGGKFGRMIIPGDPLTSNLMVLVEGRADPSIQMPHGREQIPERDIKVLRVWIREGARNN